MFNLIVSGSGWRPHHDSFGSGRVLEYTDAAVVQRFMQNKVLDINAVKKLPTMFMSETQGSGNQVATDKPRTCEQSHQDWETRLNRFIDATDREVWQNASRVPAEIAKTHAMSEFENHRIVQDRLFESGFDRLPKEMAFSEKQDYE